MPLGDITIINTILGFFIMKYCYLILLLSIIINCENIKDDDEESTTDEDTAASSTTTSSTVDDCSSTLSYPVGINIGINRYWSSQVIFVDAFKASSMWIPNISDSTHPSYNSVWDTDVDIPLDARGYPLEIPYTPTSGEWAGVPQRVSSVIWGGMEGHFPTGTYTLIFEGTGRMTVGNWSGQRNEFVNGGTYQVEVVSANEGIIFELYESSAADPVRNIRFILPGYEDTYSEQPFYPRYIEGLQIFQVIRATLTIGMLGYYECDNGVDDTSADCVMTWGNRAKTDYARYSTLQGIPYKLLIDLINKTKADMWVNVMHAADDDYIRNFASLIKERLASDRKIYLELANETWNLESNNFPQTYYYRNKGLAAGLDTDAKEAGRKYFMKRQFETYAIFDEVFGDQSTRIITVLGTQFGVDWEHQRRIANISDSTVNPNGIRPDVFAIGAYFGGHINESGADPATITVDGVLDLTEHELTDMLVPRLQSVKTLTEANGMELIAYEGGTHIVDYDNLWGDHQTKLRDANRHDRMSEIFNDFLDIWERENPGKLLMLHDYVSYPQGGSFFGLLEWTDQDIADAPKYRTVKERICP